MRLSTGRSALENLARFRRAAIVGIVMVAALALAGMTCTSADELPTTTPVAAVGLEAMSGRAVKLPAPGPADRERFIALSVGKYHNCALREDGRALCWGQNGSDQSSAPANEVFVAISAGADHTCGLRQNGATVCWGRWHYQGPEATSQLGEKLVAINAGGSHTCGLREDGIAVCWGEPKHDIDRWPIPNDKFITIVTREFAFACGIKADGSSLCWDSSSSYIPESFRPDGLAFLSRGGHCGLTISGDLYCHNYSNREIYSSRNFESITDEKFVYLGSSWDDYKQGFICGIRPSGSAGCWSVRDNRDQDWNIPNIPSTQKFLDIGTGSEHACGLLADGSIKCWGSNHYGQVSSSLAQTVPPSVPPSDVLCNPGVVVVKGSSCRLPKSIQAEVHRFAVTADGEGVVYGEADEIYEIRHVNIDIGFHGNPVLVEDGWYRLEPRHEGGPRCEGAGNAYDLFSGHQLWGFSDAAQGSSALPAIIRTCIVLAATADANGDWIVDKTLVWEAHI